MPFQTACPSCKATYKVNESPQARKISCKRCGTPFVIPARTAPPATQAGAPRAQRPPVEELPHLDPLPEKSRLGLFIGIAVAVLLVLGGGGVGLYFALAKPMTEEEKLALELQKGFQQMGVDKAGGAPDFNKIFSNMPNIDKAKKGIPVPPDIGKIVPPDIGKIVPPDIGKIAPPDIGNVFPNMPGNTTSKSYEQMTPAELMVKAELNQVPVSGEALRELAKRDPNHPQRADIAKRLLALINSKQLTFSSPINPFVVWATPEHTPDVVAMIQQDRHIEKLIPWLSEKRPDTAIPLLLEILGKKEYHGYARQGLQSCGDKAVPALVEHAFKKDYGGRGAVREILQKLNVPSDRLLPGAIALLKTGKQAEKMQVLQWLRAEKIPVQDKERPEVAKALNEFIKPSEVDDVVIAILKDWGTKDNMPAVLTALASPRCDRVEPYLQCATPFVADCAEEAFPIFVSFLDKPFVDRHAAVGLRKLGPMFAPKLAELAFHRNGNIRTHVNEILKDWKTPIDVLLPYAVEAALGNEPDSRSSARNWLAATKPGDVKRDDIAKKLDVLLQERDLHTPLEILTKWGDKENVPTLLALVGKPNVPRDEIYRLLGKLKDERAVPVLVARMNIERREVLNFLREVGPEMGTKPALAYLNDPDAFRDVRKLMEEWKVKPEILLEQTLKDVGSDQARTKETAIRYVGDLPLIEEKREDVLKIVGPIVEDDKTPRETAKAYFLYADKSSVETLVKLTTNERSNHRNDAMEALARFPEPKSAMAIASRIPHGEHQKAVELLKKMGPLAEAPATLLLQHKDSRVRVDAVNILAEVGTAKCIPAMNAAGNLYRNDRNFIEAGFKAQAAIKARMPVKK